VPASRTLYPVSHTIGFPRLTISFEYASTNFCKNVCLRTFIDVKTENTIANFVPIARVTKVPIEAGERRLIIATFGAAPPSDACARDAA
jgi:hypothetical protein